MIEKKFGCVSFLLFLLALLGVVSCPTLLVPNKKEKILVCLINPWCSLNQFLL